MARQGSAGRFPGLRDPRWFVRALMLGGLVISQGAYADQILPDGVTAASDVSAIPLAARSRKDTVVASIRAPQGLLNPYLFVNGWDENATFPIFGRLLGRDKQGFHIPEQAESWEISKDGRVYTLKLREGVLFSDGTPLTAEDVAFTLTFLHDPAYDGLTDIKVAAIEGGEAYKAGKATSIPGIKVIDPRTIEVRVTRPGATTLTLLTGPVLSKAWYGKDYQPGKLDGVRALNGKPIGAGPYTFVSYIPGQEVRYRANPKYYAGKPAVENFIHRVSNDATQMQLLQTGETDYDGFSVSQDTIDTLKSLGFVNINLYGSSDYSLIDFNHKKPHFKDPRVRQALSHGLDRAKLCQVVYQGYGSVATVPVAPVSWAYNTEGVDPFAFDSAKAAALLDEAGWKPGPDGVRAKDGQRLALTLMVTKSLLNDALIAIAKENYKAIGVELLPEVTDFNALLAKRTSGSFDLASYRTSTIDDPHDGVQPFLTTESKVSYSNPKVDQLVNEANASLDLDFRKKAYHSLYKLLAEDPPRIFLCYRKILTGTNARVENLNADLYNGIRATLPILKIVK